MSCKDTNKETEDVLIIALVVIFIILLGLGEVAPDREGYIPKEEDTMIICKEEEISYE